MKDSLKEQLSDMTDVEFRELRMSIGIATDLRRLVRYNSPFSEEEVCRHLDIGSFEFHEALNGVVDFDVRQLAILDSLIEDLDDYLAINEVDDDDEDEDEDGKGEKEATEKGKLNIVDDIPDEINYGILEGYLDGEDHLGYKPPIRPSQAPLPVEKGPSMEELQKEVFEKHQQKIKEGTAQKQEPDQFFGFVE